MTAETTIAADRLRVAAYAMEPANDPVWIGGITEAEILTEPPLERGSKVRRVATFLGKRIEYVMEVEQLEVGSQIVMRTARSPFPMLVTYSFEDDVAGTRARVRVQGVPGRFYRLTGPLMARAVRRSISKDVRRLRRIMETA